MVSFDVSIAYMSMMPYEYNIKLHYNPIIP